MTVIAYRKGVLASDGMACRGEFIDTLSEKKVHKLSDGRLVGACGDCAETYPFVKALDRPLAELPKLTESTVIVVAKDGRSIKVYSEKGHYVTPIDGEYFNAWGSGRDAAMAAMHCGKTAAQAVMVAMKVYNNIGGELFVESLWDQSNVAEYRPRPKPEDGSTGKAPDAPVAA